MMGHHGWAPVGPTDHSANCLHMPTFSRLLILVGLLVLLALPSFAQLTDNHELFAVPAPGPVTVDGVLGEWDLSGAVLVCYDVAQLLDGFSGRVAMMYDREALYVGVDWRDATPMVNNYDPRFDQRFCFHADSLQLHVKTDLERNFIGWYFTKGKVPGLAVMDGEKWYHENPIVYTDGLTALGITQAFVKKADNAGYTQELRLPWTALSKSGRVYQPGESFACMLDLVWGPESGKGWPVSHCMDLVKPGAVHTGWFWEISNLYGKVTLSPTGHLTSTAAVPVRAKPTLPGPIPIRVSLPADATRFTVAINDAGGRRVRNLIGDVSPEDFSVKVAGKRRTVEVRWDGFDDAGRLVAPGSYQVVGLSHRGLDARYEQSFYNPGTPPWLTEDGSGAWGADHASPSRVATTGEWTVVSWAGCEGGSGIIGIGPDGRKRWGEKQGALALAADGDSVYFLLNDDWARKSGLARLNLTDGAYKPFVQDGTSYFPLALETIFGGPAPGTVLAMAARGDTLVLAMSQGKLAVLDAASARLRATIDVPKPTAVALGGKGECYALLDGKLCAVNLATGVATPIPTPGLGVARALALDPAGNLALVDAGPDCQVKVYTPAGKLKATLGKKGGRPIRGAFDSQGMRAMSAVAVDSRGQTWVTENWDFPRRVSVWGPDGKLVRDYIGNTGYAGTGCYLHDQDPELAYCGPIEMRLDRAKGSWKVTQVLWVPGEGESFPIQANSSEHPQRFRSAVSGTMCEYLYSHQDGHVVYMPRKGGWQPVAAVCLVGQISGGIRRDGTLVSEPSGAMAGFNAFDGCFWNDRNGDGKVQREECVILPTRNPGTVSKRGTPALQLGCWWGTRIADDLILYAGADSQPADSSMVAYVPIGYTADGAPIYGPGGMRTLGIHDWGDFAPVNGAATLVVMSNTGYGKTSAIRGYDRTTGRSLWSYPSAYHGVHGSHHASMPAPGLIIGATQLVGVARVTEAIGDVCMIRGNLGEDYLLTAGDGLYVGALLQDGRLPSPALPVDERALRGQSMARYSEGGEPFNGWFGRQQDGKLRLINGIPREAAMCLAVIGLDTLQRFEGPRLTVDMPALVAAERAHALRVTAAATPPAYTIRRLAGPPVIDGQGKEWAAIPALTIERAGQPSRGQARLAYDDTMLYLLYEVDDASPWQNEGKDYTQLFKTGDAVDLQLGTDPAAPRRIEPGPGDVRVTVALLNGKPAAVLLRPRDPAAPPALRVNYHSPVGDRRFDRVEVLSEARVAVTVDRARYRVELALPLAALGVSPTPGLRLRGDLGVIASDAEGRSNVARIYWANKATNLVSDLPSEAWFFPQGWGTLGWE
jgi:hypothetical protein